MNSKNNLNNLNVCIDELRKLGLNKSQIITICEVIQINHFTYKYGSIYFDISPNMKVGEVKDIKTKVELILQQADISVYTNVSLSQLVFDIEH